MERYTAIIGRAVSRNGDLLCIGNYLDSGSRRLSRICRSSLATEAAALGNAADLGTFVRVLIIEMAPGEFHKELCDPSQDYKLNIPFGASPTAEAVLAESKRISEKHIVVHDLRQTPDGNETISKRTLPNQR